MNIDKVISGPSTSGLASGLAGGILSGALTSKKGRAIGETALKIGGIAGLGCLAWKACDSYGNAQSTGPERGAAPLLPAHRPAPESASPSWQSLSEGALELRSAHATEGSRGLLLIRAMIAAAVADGHIDADEQRRIFEKMDELDLAGRLALPAELVAAIENHARLERLRAAA